jgi:hypothetical protein
MVAPSQPIIGKISKDKDVMGALRGKKQSKDNIVYGSPTIIMQTLTNQGMPKEQAENSFKSISQKVKQGTLKIVQIRNTAFIVTPKPDMSAEFFVTSLEPEALPKRINALSKSLKQMGFRKMTTLSPVNTSKKIADETGLPVKVTQTQMMSGKQMVPAYRYEVAL